MIIHISNKKKRLQNYALWKSQSGAHFSLHSNWQFANANRITVPKINGFISNSYCIILFERYFVIDKMKCFFFHELFGLFGRPYVWDEIRFYKLEYGNLFPLFWQVGNERCWFDGFFTSFLSLFLTITENSPLIKWKRTVSILEKLYLQTLLGDA